MWKTNKCKSSFFLVFQLFSLSWPSLFTAVANIPTQGGAMGVSGLKLIRDALPLPFKGSHATGILGGCTSKLPWLPFGFNTSVPRGDQPLYVLPSGPRGKVKSTILSIYVFCNVYIYNCGLEFWTPHTFLMDYIVLQISLTSSSAFYFSAVTNI